MNNHGSGYSNHILDCIICYPIFLLTYHSTVPDALALTMQISVKLLGSLYTIIFGVAIRWHSCIHGLPLKI